jgi:deoxyadenosine/deoxycytidine kinase
MKTTRSPFVPINKDLRTYGPALRGHILILEGLISAGKSTAGIELEKHVSELGIKCKFFGEPLIPDLLQLFLSNPRKYAYAFQLTMLVKRQAIYREAILYADQGYFCIIDRSLHGDYCFALMHLNRGNISDEPANLTSSSLSEWKTYLSTMKSEEFRHPDYVIYLKVTPDTAIERCKIRDRDGENKTYDREYFQELCDLYDQIIPTSPSDAYYALDWNQNRRKDEISPILMTKIKKMYDTI